MYPLKTDKTICSRTPRHHKQICLRPRNLVQVVISPCLPLLYPTLIYFYPNICFTERKATSRNPGISLTILSAILCHWEFIFWHDILFYWKLILWHDILLYWNIYQCHKINLYIYIYIYYPNRHWFRTPIMHRIYRFGYNGYTWRQLCII